MAHGIRAEQKGIKSTDYGKRGKSITILIGADIFGKLLTGKVLNIDYGMTAIKTPLC